MLSSSQVRAREPFGAPNFLREIGHVLGYVSLINNCGVTWLGLRFCYPIIWWPANFYMPVYELTKAEEAEAWQDIATTKGYWPAVYHMAESYNLSEIHEKCQRHNSDLARKIRA